VSGAWGGGKVGTVDLEQSIQGPDEVGAHAPNHKKVLVIDDSHTVIEMVRHAVEMQGKYAVVVAYDGVQGLEQYYRERPDCVIVDVMMPRMDGYQFVRCLRGDRGSSQTGLIILTALATADKQLTGILSGADEYLTKPFKPNALYSAIERVLAVTPEQREQRLIQLARDAGE
jgi:DNA-binding response OmpR family regulator